MTKLFPDDILLAAAEILAAARGKSLMIATAESCTGGLIAGALTEIAGSSAVVERGFITYSNAAKIEDLGVAANLIEVFGAVSLPVARAMAEGALNRSKAAIAVAVTGIAGPGGGTAEKPVGLVAFASARRGFAPQAEERRFGDAGRTRIRLETVRHAFALLKHRIAEA